MYRWRHIRNGQITDKYCGDAYGFEECRTILASHLLELLFQTMESDEGQYDDTRPIFWASGACLFLRKDVYNAIGGFDEDFFAHMGEVDLCWRIAAFGHHVYYCGQSTIYHVGGGTLSKSNPKKTYLNFRNGLSMFVKNEPAHNLIWKLPVRSLFDLIAALKFTFSDSIQDGLAVVKAHLHFWWRLPRNFRKRRLVWKSIPRSVSIENVYQRSIVVEYFIRGKKKFSDLKFN